MLKVTCIIPSLCSGKSYPVLKKCISSLLQSAKKSELDIKIIVITNGKKITLDGIRHNINYLLKISEPYSFAKMNNVAIDYALSKYAPDWVLLINDDAYIDKDFFSNSIKPVLEKKADLLVPLVYERNSSVIDSFGIDYFNSGYARNSANLEIKTQLAAAACLLIKANFLKKMKLKYNFYFNEILVAYFDDTEFSIRALAIGAKIIKVEKSVAYHAVSYTSVKGSWYTRYQSFRNLIWVVIMTWPVKSLLKNIFNIVLIQCWVIVSSLFAYGPIFYIKIWIDTLMNLPKLLKLRHGIVSSYSRSFEFDRILADYAFRTYNPDKMKFKIINKLQNIINLHTIKI